jgi:hypothetical protein
MTFCFPLYKLAHDPYNVVIWFLFLLLPQWYLALRPCGETTGHREMRIWVKHFLAGEGENLQEEFVLQAQALSASLNLVAFPQYDIPTHKCMLCSLAFGHVGE